MPPKKLIVRKSAEIAAPPSRVWDILISPESWPQWMLVLPQHEAGAGRLQLGSKVFWQDDNGKPYLVEAVISRVGGGAESTWHESFNLASTRRRQV